jgi:hypothetical protein
VRPYHTRHAHGQGDRRTARVDLHERLRRHAPGPPTVLARLRQQRRPWPLLPCLRDRL